jgi:hypothetical protein
MDYNDTNYFNNLNDTDYNLAKSHIGEFVKFSHMCDRADWFTMKSYKIIDISKYKDHRGVYNGRYLFIIMDIDTQEIHFKHETGFAFNKFIPDICAKIRYRENIIKNIFGNE